MDGDGGDHRPAATDDGGADELLMRFARAAHAAGFPADDLERRVVGMGSALGREVAVSATPTLVEVVIGSFPAARTTTLRVSPVDVDLDTIGRLDELAARVGDGRITAAEAIAALRDLRPRRPHPAVLVAAFGVAGAAVTPVLGGGPREALTALLGGLAVGAVAVPGTGRDRLRAVVTPAAAILASLTCALVAWAGFANGVEQATLAALVALLPGMTLTIGMRELATNHLQSGVANTAVAVVQLLGLVFGVAVGLSAAQQWFGPVGAAPGDTGDAATLAAAAVAGVALVITLNAGIRDVGWGAAAAVLAVAAKGAATPLVGEEAAVFTAALAVGLAGDVFARARRRSPLVVIVPGILMLVPGSTGYESASRLTAGDTIGGVDVAFDTLVTALAIVYGLVVSAAVMPGGRGRPSP